MRKRRNQENRRVGICENRPGDGYVSKENDKRRPLEKGRRGGASWFPANSGWAGRRRLPKSSLFEALVVVVVLSWLAAPVAVVGQGSGVGPGNYSGTLQNDRIAVFGSSYAWEPYGTHLGRIVGREVESFISGATGAGGALDGCSVFNTEKFGIIVTDFGSWDAMVGAPWSEIEVNLRELFQRLKASGAVVVYNQLIPDSSDVGEYAFARVCREEEVYLAPNITEGIATGIPDASGTGFTILVDPVFKPSGEHPCDEGYSIMAERTARTLFEVGLVEREEPCEGLSLDVPGLFANATDLLKKAEQEGFDTEAIREAYSMAEYLWENQHCYTTSWELEEEVLEPLVNTFENLDEVTQMFSRAEALMDEAREKGMNTDEMETNHEYAETSWRRMDPSIAKYYLQKILDLEEEIGAFQEPVMGKTVFEDDFDAKDFENWMWREGAEGTVNLRDGYIFLNLTDGEGKREACLLGMDESWRYAGVEVRLRCSDDNMLESDRGGGFRAWGFLDDIPGENILGFTSYCPESDPEMVGFSVTSMVGGETVFREPVTGVDMTDWHTYTVIWDRNNATFLVDGELVSTCNRTPSSRQRLFVLTQSGAWSEEGPGYRVGGFGYVEWIELKHDQHIQIDRVRVFGVPETAMLSVLCLLLPVIQKSIRRVWWFGA